MTAPFVHLRLHTEYSLVDGLIRVKNLVRQVATAHTNRKPSTITVNRFTDGAPPSNDPDVRWWWLPTLRSGDFLLDW